MRYLVYETVVRVFGYVLYYSVLVLGITGPLRGPNLRLGRAIMVLNPANVTKLPWPKSHRVARMQDISFQAITCVKLTIFDVPNPDRTYV